MFRCRLDPFEALAEEYKRRVREVKQAQFLGHFLERHPGIQHKAGVPLGGTFILVYHELPKPAPDTRPPRTGPVIGIADRGLERSGLRARRERRLEKLGDALARLPVQGASSPTTPTSRLVYQIVTGNVLVPQGRRCRRSPQDVYLETIAKLADGTVIADFFLPYECCSDCAPIQYQLPSGTPAGQHEQGVHQRRRVRRGHAHDRGRQRIAVGRRSTAAPSRSSTGTLLLGVGEHTIVVRDAAGNESSPVEITHPAPAA